MQIFTSIARRLLRKDIENGKTIEKIEFCSRKLSISNGVIVLPVSIIVSGEKNGGITFGVPLLYSCICNVKRVLVYVLFDL